MKHFLLLFSLILIPITHWAQSPLPLGSISGTTMDSGFQEPIPYATISVHDAADKLISGTVSSNKGTFSLDQLPEGSYTLKVQFMGFNPVSKEFTITQANQDIHIGTLYLEPSVSELDDVTVVAETSTIEQRIDRKVVNVGKDLTASGASAVDIMNNIPSVSVDMDGNLALRGNQNVRILVDGKPTNMDAATLLKQIPSSSIKQIELITNPSAKYNPEGMSGIINIVLHKNTNLGFNGDVNTGVTIGKKINSNAGLNLNYRQGKFNVYTNLGFSNRNWMQDIELLNHTSNSGEYLYFEDVNKGYLGKFGIDFHLDDKNIFSVYTNQNLSSEDMEGISEIRYFTDSSLDYSQLMTMDQKNRSSTYNFDYRHLFDQQGHEIELEIDYNRYHNEDEADFKYLNTEALQAYQDQAEKEFHNTMINLDYVLPLNQNGKLELGAESRLRRTQNDYLSNKPELETILYSYNSDIHSLYATYGHSGEQWNYQLGARLENYWVRAQESQQEIFSDNRWTLYPSAFVSYTPGELNSFQASYSRRVDRPSLNQVSPLRQISTPRLTVSGNPELEPQYTNSLEINYTRKLGRHSITAGVFYRMITDDINEIMEEDPQNPEHFILTYHNTQDNKALGTEISARLKPTEFWDLNMDFNLYSQTLKGVLAGQNIEQDNTFWRLQAHNTFKLSSRFRLQMLGMYMSRQKSLQFEVEEMYFVNLGARYNFWQDKASLSLNLNDMFNTRIQRLHAKVPQVQQGTFYWDSRTVYLGFSYRFGNNKSKALERKDRDTEDSGGGGMF